MNILLEDTNRINKYISEELGISDCVQRVSSEIFYYIIDNIPKVQSIAIDNGIKEKKFSIKKEINQSKIEISVQYFNFSNKDIYKQYIQKHNIDNKSVSLDGRINFVWIKLIAISGYFDRKELNDSIYHEIEHIYQQILSRKTFNNQEIYSIAFKNIHNQDLFFHAPAHILYMATKSEQDAYANGLYGYFASEYNYFPDIKDISKTDIYKELQRLRKNIIFLKKNINNKELEKSVQELYNLSIQKIIFIGQKAEKEILRKIGRVIIKIKDDFLKRGGEIHLKQIGEEKERNFYFL